MNDFKTFWREKCTEWQAANLQKVDNDLDLPVFVRTDWTAGQYNVLAHDSKKLVDTYVSDEQDKFYPHRWLSLYLFDNQGNYLLDAFNDDDMLLLVHLPTDVWHQLDKAVMTNMAAFDKAIEEKNTLTTETKA